MTTILETLRPFGITRCYKGFPLTVYAIHLAVMEEDPVGRDHRENLSGNRRPLRM